MSDFCDFLLNFKFSKKKKKNTQIGFQLCYCVIPRPQRKKDLKTNTNFY